MSITTLEELEALPVGAQFRVAHESLGDQEWVREQDGFSRGGVTIGAKHFTGAVTSGLVKMAPRVEVGQVYHSGAAQRYLVVWVDGQEDNSQVGLVWWRGLTYRGFLVYNVAVVVGMLRYEGELPEWLPVIQGFGADYAHQRWELEAARRTLSAQHVEQQRVLTDEMVAQLLVIAQQNSLLNTRLGEWGIVQDHTTTIVMTGTQTYSPDDQEAHELIDDEDTCRIESVDPATIHWSKSFEITRSGVGCTCAEITRDFLISNEWTPRNWDTFEFTTTCPDDGHRTTTTTPEPEPF